MKTGVQPGSWTHLTEWFGPVLGVMRAPDLDTAIDWQNAVEYGLTAGIHALDAGECEQWIQRIEAGNIYVNRGTTGAIVNRQPFGGWRKSAVGPTAKAGGENYVACLRDWAPGERALTSAEVQAWWAGTASAVRDLTGLTVRAQPDPLPADGPADPRARGRRHPPGRPGVGAPARGADRAAGSC